MTLPALPRFPKSAYGPKHPRIVGVKRKPAGKRGWGKGWPDCGDQQGIRVEANRVTIRGIDVRAAELFEFLFKAANALGYDIRRASERDGGVSGYACRAIKGSGRAQASVHSVRVAVDQNTRSQPQGRFQSVTPPGIVRLFESGGFYWGGRFPKGYEDCMHFEQLFPPSEIDANLASVQAEFAAQGGTTLYPTLRLGATNAAMVRVLQFRLNGFGFLISDEGDFDEPTNDAVLDFQDQQGLVVDGIVGPLTWAALNG